MIVYMMAPVFDYLVSKINQKVLICICLVLAVLYGTDLIYSNKHPNMAKGAIEEPTETENVDELLSESEQLPAQIE